MGEIAPSPYFPLANAENNLPEQDNFSKLSGSDAVLIPAFSAVISGIAFLLPVLPVCKKSSKAGEVAWFSTSIAIQDAFLILEERNSPNKLNCSRHNQQNKFEMS